MLDIEVENKEIHIISGQTDRQETKNKEYQSDR
jgi:hypothetical protein